MHALVCVIKLYKFYFLRLFYPYCVHPHKNSSCEVLGSPFHIKCVYLCVCITYIYIYTHTHIYIYIYIYIHIFFQSCDQPYEGLLGRNL